jgi:hypothetical protein
MTWMSVEGYHMEHMESTTGRYKTHLFYTKIPIKPTYYILKYLLNPHSSDADRDSDEGGVEDWWKKDVFRHEGVKRTFSDIVHNRDAGVGGAGATVCVYSLTTTFR